jgi:hypothetical protein
LTGAGVALALALGCTPAHAENLIDAAPSLVSISVPAPGHSEAWEMTVKNRTDRTLELGLVVSTGGDALLFDGPTPLVMTVTDSSKTVLTEVPSTRVVVLPDLAPHAVYMLHGEVALPGAADNAYQGLSGEISLRFTATDKGEASEDPNSPKKTASPSADPDGSDDSDDSDSDSDSDSDDGKKHPGKDEPWSLPFTGFDALVVGVTGFFALAVGYALRKGAGNARGQRR